MSFELVSTDWKKVFQQALENSPNELRIICPFITDYGAHLILEQGKPEKLKIITRFNLNDCYAGVSDLSALRRLLEAGAIIRGVKGLHAKVYLFGNDRVIVTSANLTRFGFTKNQEFGIVSDDPEAITASRNFFRDLWQKAGKELTISELEDWEQKVYKARLQCAPGSGTPKLPDHGTKVETKADSTPNLLPSSPPPPAISEANQWIISFFGEGDNRCELSISIIDEIVGSGSHRECNYPKGKHPRRAKEGAVIFLARMVQNPTDRFIYGRAIGMKHRDDRDNASHNDIKRRPWKENWPHYIRVHHPEFLAGTLANGISLNKLMDTFKEQSFAPTARNAAADSGNTNPKQSISHQQPDVELTEEAATWLNEQLEKAFQQHGKLSPEDMKHLDWPK